MSGHNNPIKLALWESLRIDPSFSRPDLVVSVGTGTSRKGTSPRAASFRHVLFDGFIPRLWRAYMSSFDGESNFRDVVNSLDDENREDYRRLNVVLPRNEPAMDNTSRMDELRQLVHRNPQKIQECEETIYALLIASFYFELSCIPSPLPGNRIRCLGMIRCRLPGEIIVKLLERVHPSRLSFVTHNKALGYYLGNSDLCPWCRRYRKSVEFTVRDLGQLTFIYATSAKKSRRKISAFPQTMQWFIDKQHLDAPFGTAYHASLKRSCKSCLAAASCELKRKAPGDENQRKPFKKLRLH